MTSDKQPDARLLRHEIPTHLDVQDRLILGLTARQTMLLMVGLATAYAVWNHLATTYHFPPVTGIGAAAACVLLTAAAVWIRPHSRGAEKWAFVLLRYAALPKTAVWRAEASGASDWCPSAPSAGEWAEFPPAVGATAPSPGSAAGGAARAGTQGAGGRVR